MAPSPFQISSPALPAPAETAAALRHLPGLVFLDSSSADGVAADADPAAGFSLLTARPARVLRGNLFDPAGATALAQAYAGGLRSAARTADLGFPTDGLYGWIGYDGDYCFGEYREFLVYEHRSGTWWERGALSLEARRGPPLRDGGAASVPFRPSTSREEFLAMVARAQEYIAAGDIYQVNLSHRFEADVPGDFNAYALHLRLREESPASFAAFLSLGGREVVSSSPEQFLRLSGRSIQTRPIKGTRPRFRDRAQDEKSAYDLLTSPKEIAELIMITDLERNDLGQICEFGSVQATELLKLERYAQVFHLVSTVEGELRPEVDHVSALLACFPGGSITGAPKRRAREIIAELEPVPRGLYTGAIGCFGFNGESRFNIAIRTAVREGGSLRFHAGAGIVADSVPGQEWEETLHKAAGILRACGAPFPEP